MNYIGIRGHRGSGKSSIAYLLGCTINYIASKSQEDFHEKYLTWCQNAYDKPKYAPDLEWVIFETFGGIPKMFVSMLTGIPYDDLNNQEIKDNTCINLRNFNKSALSEIKDGERILTAEELFDIYKDDITLSPKQIKDDVYITVRDFVIFFGIYVMQNAFGRNVWIKSMIVNNKYFEGLFSDDEQYYKIYTDVKTPSEISYIQNKGGVVVKISRPNHKKNGGMDLLQNNPIADYKIYTEGKLEDLETSIYELAQKIINKFSDETI